MQLLPTEEIIVSSNADKIILTNQRIHLSDKEWGRSYQITIFLENISSLEMLYKSNPLYAILAGICFLFGLLMLQGYGSDGTLRFGSFMIAIIFLSLYFYSKSQVVTIASDGGSKLTFRTEGMKTTDVEGFIDKVMLAKANRAGYFLE